LNQKGEGVEGNNFMTAEIGVKEEVFIPDRKLR